MNVQSTPRDLLAFVEDVLRNSQIALNHWADCKDQCCKDITILRCVPVSDVSPPEEISVFFRIVKSRAELKKKTDIACVHTHTKNNYKNLLS